MSDIERELKVIAKDLHWMARRYADGRSSYATSLFNRHTRKLLRLGVELNQCGEGTIWARDSMGRRFDGLSDDEAAMGSPLTKFDTFVDEDIAKLRAENERLKSNDVHSCHDQCQRVACVQRREIDKLREEKEQFEKAAKSLADANDRHIDARNAAEGKLARARKQLAEDRIKFLFICEEDCPLPENCGPHLQAAKIVKVLEETK